MKTITKKQKITATVEMVAAAIVIIVAVIAAPKLFADKEEPTKAPVSDVQQTVQSTEAPTVTEAAPQNGGVQPIGEYSLSGYIVVTNDAAMEMYSIAKKSLLAYADSVNNLAAKLPSTNIYVMLAPTRMEFYGPEEYRTGSHSQKDGIAISYGQLSPFVTGIDAYTEISRHTNEYLYFRTDHHWTARGAYYAYKAFCDTARLKCPPLDSYERGQLDDFVGSMYRYTQSENLNNNPDYVEYFMPQVEASGQFFSTGAMDDGKNLKIISTNITERSSKYLAFIQGDKPLIKMTSNCGSEKKILLIKESYGNALAPFLLQNFSEVYVLDPRQPSIQGLNLPQFLTDNSIDNVLFCNYTMVPSNSKYMDSLNNMINQDINVQETTQAPAE